MANALSHFTQSASCAGDSRNGRPTVGPKKSASRLRRQWLVRPVSNKGLAEFTRQLAILVKAGLPLLRSLEVLARQTPRGAFRGVVESLADAIRSGGNLSDGLTAHEQIFGRLYVNMVR